MRKAHMEAAFALENFAYASVTEIPVQMIENHEKFSERKFVNLLTIAGK